MIDEIELAKYEGQGTYHSGPIPGPTFRPRALAGARHHAVLAALGGRPPVRYPFNAPSSHLGRNPLATLTSLRFLSARTTRRPEE